MVYLFFAIVVKKSFFFPQHKLYLFSLHVLCLGCIVFLHPPVKTYIFKLNLSMRVVSNTLGLTITEFWLRIAENQCDPSKKFAVASDAVLSGLAK